MNTEKTSSAKGRAKLRKHELKARARGSEYGASNRRAVDLGWNFGRARGDGVQE